MDGWGEEDSTTSNDDDYEWMDAADGEKRGCLGWGGFDGVFSFFFFSNRIDCHFASHR
jgi:hypothetical protein